MKWIAPLLLVSALLTVEYVAPVLNFHPGFRILKERLARFSLKRPPALPLDQVVAGAAKRTKLPAAMIKSIIKAESGFNPDARSDKGAIGLMQLMPETARDLDADPSQPDQNVYAGARYLSWLFARYHKHKDGVQRAVAAYNAGPGNVDKYKGVPPFAETRAYVKRVLGYYRNFQARPMVARVRRRVGQEQAD